MKTPQAPSPSASRQRNATPTPVFPDDLIVEILTRLPVKPLVKFRCVCKSWKSLISDPNFVKLHLRRSARNPSLLLVLQKDPQDLNLEGDYPGIFPCSVLSLLGKPSPTFDEDDCFRLNGNSEYQIVGSRNGLVCYYLFMIEKCCFYLWNPATKLTCGNLAPLAVSEGCFYYSFALGYDNLSDTYKVLAFGFNEKAEEESQKNHVKICSLGDNCWRDIHSFPLIPFHNDDHPEHNNGVYINGTLNWLALCNIKSGSYVWDESNIITIAQLVIISLDLGMETCTTLMLPRLDEAPPVEPTIGVLMDCLCFSHDCKKTHLVVWQMKEFGFEKSWTQFVKVGYQDLQFDYFHFDYPLLPLCMSENGDVLIMGSRAKSQAILYHLRDNRVEQTEIKNYICWKSTMDYVESLISPCRY